MAVTASAARSIGGTERDGQSIITAERLASMRAHYEPRSYEREAIFHDDYLLAASGAYRMYYAPFGTVLAKHTRLVFVGLTPGYRQTVLAAQTFRAADSNVRANEAAFSDVLRARVAFAGTMRVSLCEMLDSLGVPGLFGVATSLQFFTPGHADVAMMSVLPYPVVAGPERKNYGGSRGAATVPLFARTVEECFIPRVAAAPDTSLVPLGVAAESLVDYAVRLGALEPSRVIRGLPHPSSANVGRKRIFGRNAARLGDDFRDRFG